MAKTEKEYPVVVVNPDVKDAELATLVNGLSEDVRKGYAAGDLAIDKSDVAYLDKGQEKKFVKYFVRVQAANDAGIAYLSSLDLAEKQTAESVRVTFFNAGKDGKERSAIRQSIVDGVAGPGKTLTKAASTLDSLSEMDNVTAEQLAILEAKFAALKAKVAQSAETVAPTA